MDLKKFFAELKRRNVYKVAGLRSARLGYEGPNWELIAAKLAEVPNVQPWSEGTAILLGNASVKLDRRDEAIRAL